MVGCSKPSCSQTGAVVLSYDYAARRIVISDLVGQVSPHEYLMCLRCVERLSPPRGWTLEDRRIEDPMFADMDEDRVLRLEPETAAPTRRIFYGSNF